MLCVLIFLEMCLINGIQLDFTLLPSLTLFVFSFMIIHLWFTCISLITDTSRDILFCAFYLACLFLCFSLFPLLLDKTFFSFCVFPSLFWKLKTLFLLFLEVTPSLTSIFDIIKFHDIFTLFSNNMRTMESFNSYHQYLCSVFLPASKSYIL